MLRLYVKMRTRAAKAKRGMKSIASKSGHMTRRREHPEQHDRASWLHISQAKTASHITLKNVKATKCMSGNMCIHQTSTLHQSDICDLWGGSTLHSSAMVAQALDIELDREKMDCMSQMD